MTTKQEKIQLLVEYIHFMAAKNMRRLAGGLKLYSADEMVYPTHEIRQSADIIRYLSGAFEKVTGDEGDERVEEFIAEAKKRMNPLSAEEEKILGNLFGIK